MIEEDREQNEAKHQQEIQHIKEQAMIEIEHLHTEYPKQLKEILK